MVDRWTPTQWPLETPAYKILLSWTSKTTVTDNLSNSKDTGFESTPRRRLQFKC